MQSMDIPLRILERLNQLKSEMTYEQLSKHLDVPVPTLYRWFSKRRMNRFYVKLLSQRWLSQQPITQSIHLESLDHP